MDDFDHLFGCWWENDGHSPVHKKWSAWYSDQIMWGAKIGHMTGLTADGWGEFQQIKIAIYEGILIELSRSGVTR